MPHWAARLQFAREFGVLPHELDGLPVSWWMRWQAIRRAQNARQAFDYIEAHGLRQASQDAQALYAWLFRDDE